MDMNDLSQLSDLSGVSRIRSSSPLSLNKADSISILSETSVSSSIRDPTGKPDASGIVKAVASCENAIIDYAKLVLIQESLQRATTHSETLPRGTATKLEDILAMHEAKKYSRLPNTDNNSHEELRLLGIMDMPQIQLGDNEKRDIRTAMENIMREKLKKFIACYEKQGGNVKDAVKNQDSLGKSCLAVNQGSDLMRWKDHTDDICGEYYRNLLECADLVRQWQRLKYIDMREHNLKKAESLLLEAQVAELQAKITKNTCALKMLKETPHTTEAFQILSENLDAKIHEAHEQLRKTRAMKTTYEDVSSSEYGQVLKKYTELVNVIKKKEVLMEKL